MNLKLSVFCIAIEFSHNFDTENVKTLQNAKIIAELNVKKCV